MKGLQEAIMRYMAIKNLNITDAVYHLGLEYGLSHPTINKARKGVLPRRQKTMMSLKKIVEDWSSEK